MNKILSIISIVLLLGLFTGCKKYLELEPSQSISENIALTSDKNVKNVLTGAYSQFANWGIYGGCLLRNAELLGGDNEIVWVGTYIDPRQIFLKTMLAENSDTYAQWQQSYAVINTVNNILSALSVVNLADRDRVEGEALFLRSMMYFDLVRFFGDQYKPGVANTQLGVPLVLTPTAGINEGSFVGRNTVDEVYARVIADLIIAAAKLPEDNDVYASSGAATALLARVYLQKGDYANARTAANTVIGGGFYSLQAAYADVFNNDNNTSEDIFATQITPQDRISSMTEFFSVPAYGGRTGDIEIEAAHLALYPAGDDRLALFFVGEAAMRTGKWNNKYGVVNLIRLAEMYLIRAESNKVIDATEATFVGATPLADYNTIHQRAGLAAAVSVTLADIRMERRLELAFEGFRIHDQRRLHENVGTLPYNDPTLLYPIPARDIEANPTLKTQQNPGY
jgi:hypothetical protein